MFSLGACCPCLSPIQESVDDTGIVQYHLGCDGQLGSLVDSVGQSSQGRCSFAEVVMDFSIQRHFVSDCGAEIRNGVNPFHLVVVDGDER